MRIHTFITHQCIVRSRSVKTPTQTAMTQHTELTEGETYTIEAARGMGGREVTVTNVGMEYVEVEAAQTVGRRTTTETELFDKAEAQDTFRPA